MSENIEKKRRMLVKAKLVTRIFEWKQEFWGIG